MKLTQYRAAHVAGHGCSRDLDGARVEFPAGDAGIVPVLRQSISFSPTTPPTIASRNTTFSALTGSPPVAIA